VGRRLGQHFLFDPGILDRIVEALDPKPDDRVIEIGPGKGTLTRRLAVRVGRVVVIEKDAELARELGERGKGKGERENTWGRVTVVAGDALRENWHTLLEPTFPLSPFPFPPFKVCGNIPYAITSPLIDKALTPPLPERIVFLVQKEVADRLAAKPGGKAYGALTVGVQAVARVERLFVVRAGSFRPPPEVESAVVRLTPLGEPIVKPDEVAAFRSFITKLFGQRRKQILRSLQSAIGLEKADAASAAAAIGVDRAARVEVMSPQTLVDLYREVVSLTR
jgi:16S rRNA (adenine1518-N6/adenine1519-N6)-dimethyltransferase